MSQPQKPWSLKSTCNERYILWSLLSLEKCLSHYPPSGHWSPLTAMPTPLGTSSSPCPYQNSFLYNVLLLTSYCNDGPPKRYYNLIVMLATHIPALIWSHFECLATSSPLQLFTEYLQTWQWFLMFIASFWHLFLIYGKKPSIMWNWFT